MSQILVVGSLAYDTISSPEGRAEKCLGGSANYFSLAAHRHAGVRIVGVVGEDYADKDLAMLKDRNVDTTGLQIQKGKTFHWEGKYEGDMNEAITVATDLNVFEHFQPEIPDSYKDTPFVFLANIDPTLQLKVMEQVNNPKIVASDTMNLWINIKKDELLKVVSKVDLLVINDGEATQLTGTKNAIAASEQLMTMGPKAVVIKRGEFGFIMRSADGFFALPAYPVAKVVDPTGAGDSFAGAMFGQLAKKNAPLDFQNLKEACLHGAVFASFTVQDFGMQHLANLPEDAFEQRLREFKGMVTL